MAYRAGFTSGLFELAKVLLRWLPGGLAISTIAASGGFAALSGSSIANSATIGRMAVPEMVSGGYGRGFACATVAAGGTLGALIPPSILMIVFGIFAEVSVNSIFLGGIVVGVLSAFSYVVVILTTAFIRPDIVPRRAEPGESTIKLGVALRNAWPAIALAGCVLGGLFTGIFTPTEAGAVGSMMTFVVAGFLGRLTKEMAWFVLSETVLTTTAIFIVAVGATMFTRFLGITGLSSYLVLATAGLELTQLTQILLIVAIYLVLGMFMEPFGALLITLPVFLPMIRAEGIDMVWFGVLVVKLLEIGMITPPIGLNVFVVKRVAGMEASLMRIFAAVVPFLVADAFVVACMIVAPGMVRIFG